MKDGAFLSRECSEADTGNELFFHIKRLRNIAMIHIYAIVFGIISMPTAGKMPARRTTGI